MCRGHGASQCCSGLGGILLEISHLRRAISIERPLWKRARSSCPRSGFPGLRGPEANSSRNGTCINLAWRYRGGTPVEGAFLTTHDLELALTSRGGFWDMSLLFPK